MSAVPYRYLDDIAGADAAFEAYGQTPEELVIAASDALVHIMVDNIDSIEPRRSVDIRLESDTFEMLLFRLLDEIVYYKDAERLLLRVQKAEIREIGDFFLLSACARGEEIDLRKHHMIVDVKAITMHRYTAAETRDGWKATVVVDV